MKVFLAAILGFCLSFTLNASEAPPLCYRLLGEQGSALQYTTSVSRVSPAWLDHHLVGSKEKALAVYPAAAYLDGILAAMMSQRERATHETIVLENVEIPSALPLLAARKEKPASEATLKTTLVPNDRGYGFTIASRGEHLKGQASFGTAFAPFPALFLKAEAGADIVPAVLYSDLEKRGLPYGETFRLVRNAIVTGATSAGEITPHDSLNFSEHFIHPAITDSALHMVAAILVANPNRWDIPEKFRSSIALPVGFDRVQAPTKRFHQVRGNFTTEAKITDVKTDTEGDLKVTVKYDLLLRDGEGTVVLQITGGRLLFR